MPHVRGGLVAPLSNNKFIVCPERTVEERQVAFINYGAPVLADSRQRRAEEKHLILVKELNADHGFLLNKRSPQCIADIIGKISKERDCYAKQYIILLRT